MCQALFSGISTLPPEIWLRVFSVIADDSDSDSEADHPPRKPMQLLTLASVNRTWRSIATRHCSLWTRIPELNLTEWGMSTIRKTKKLFKLFLERSGDLPISIRCEIDKHGWRTGPKVARETLRMLTNQCHRWKSARIKMPIKFIQELDPIRGKLPVLSHLEFFGTKSMVKSSGEYLLDHFSDAPSLREAIIHTRYIFERVDPAFKVVLPWSQLEHFSEASFSGRSYSDLVKTEPQNLRKLVYKVQHVPSFSLWDEITLPKLEILRIRVGLPGPSILLHLDLLTLPALVDLEIRGTFAPADPLYPKVLALIRRSRCSLERLALDGFNSQEGVFSSILASCPKLTALDIANVDSAPLHMLALDTGSLAPIVPKLKTLVIRSRKVEGVDSILDSKALVRVIKSRTTGIPGGGACQIEPLQEVNFVWDDDEMLHLQLALLELEGESMFPCRTPESVVRHLASTTRAKLKTKIFYAQRTLKDHLNIKLHMKLNQQLKGLEEVALAEGDSRVLTVS
ncbi:hypothetical protein H1R20_g12957, partial [Candolleomyces eurysporus]